MLYRMEIKQKPFSDENTFCLPLCWLYIVFYDCFHFVCCFFLFVISNWHWQ